MKNSDYTYNYFLESFEQAKTTAKELSDGVETKVFFQKPSEKKWCMAEIMSHLIQAGNEYLPQIEKALKKPDERLSKGGEPFTPSIFFRWFIKIVSPEYPRAVPTVKSFEPLNIEEIKKNEVVIDFLKLQDTFIHILKKAKLEQLDLDHIITRNPIISFIPMSLTSCFAVQEAHQRRHFEQMRSLRNTFSI